jgi:hypothetical protein
VVSGIDAVGVVEYLVEQVVDGAARHDEPSAAPQVERIGRGCPVEGNRHVGSPVDHHRVAVVVLDVAAPDVPGVAAIPVEATEAQAGHVVVEAAEPMGKMRMCDRGVDRLSRVVGDLAGAPGAFAHRGEAAVGVVDVGLLGVEIRVRHSPRTPRQRACEASGRMPVRARETRRGAT